MAFEIVNANNLDELRSYEPETVDAIISDPPYALSFMGKAWDKVLPDPETWVECLRVLKPGGYMLTFGAPRCFHRLAVDIEDAGFELRDCIMWMFGSGFPKSLNVGKAVDAHVRTGKSDSKQTGTASRDRKGLHWSEFPKSRKDKAGVEITTIEGKQWDGWGTALKPAYEPILMARKPLIGTVAQNVAKYGTGAINVDGCRIKSPGPYGGEGNAGSGGGFEGAKKGRVAYGLGGVVTEQHQAGRWPANVILDHEAGAVLDEQSGTLKSGRLGPGHRRGIGAASYAGSGGTIAREYGNDSGGASRFFYCPKASRKEREAGLESFEAHGPEVLVGRDPESAGAKNPRAGAGRQGERKNTHPTVKPTALMAYLARLVTPPGGLILDPFCGSGSTGVAAVSEGFDFVGIEMDPHYCDIARARIENV